MGRNPLRRRTDRIEAWFRVALTTIVFFGGPFAVWWCAASAYDSAAAAAEWQRNSVFPVQARLLEDATSAAGGYEQGEATVQAQWTAPNGSQRTGPVTPPPAALAGTTIVIWTDANGNPMDRPAASPTSDAIGVALAIAGLIAAAYATALVGVRRLLDRRRMAAWQSGWRHVEPRWSGRR